MTKFTLLNTRRTHFFKKYSFPVLTGFVFLSGILFSTPVKAQLFNYYWVQSFNSVSTMLSGAVVAGDGGSSSIYYNPANISEAGNNSNLSLSAVMFSWRSYEMKNLLGQGTNPGTMNFVIQPRFVTYVYNPPKSKFTIGGTVFTRLHERTEINYTLQKDIDILKQQPGDEQYNAYFDFRNRYNDTWVGIGGAYELSSSLHAGISVFVSSVSMKYLQDIDNSAVTTTKDSSIYSAIYNNRILANFNDFRVIFKAGLSYHSGRWRLGINFTSGSFNVLSLKKKLLFSQSQANITYNGKPLPDYVLFLTRENDQLVSRIKLPFSIAAGFVYDIPQSNDQNRIYFSTEYFFRLKPYLILEAYPHPQNEEERFKHKWMSIASGSKSFANVAIGYSWKNKKNVGFMLGFRTDFNYLKDYNLGQYQDYHRLPNINADNYHFTGGAEFTIMRQKIITGLEFTFSTARHQKQIANFTDPLEYNPVDHVPLQGVMGNTVNMHYFSVNLYLSAELNFGGHHKKTGNKP